MKADIVVVYYKQLESWRKAVTGLIANKDNVGTVIFCNDELWTDKEVEELAKVTPFDVMFLDHEHVNFGACKSMNQGLAAAKSEYVAIIAADCLMPPGYLAAKLAVAAPGKVVTGPVTHVTAESTADAVEVIRTDRVQHLRDNPSNPPWSWARGANRLLHLASNVGFDEEYDERNFEDYDFYIRWCIQHGMDSIVYEDTAIMHLGDPKHEKKELPPKSLEKIRGVLARAGKALPRKVDVSVTYYKQLQYAPFFLWGLKQNARNINTIYLVNDEPWAESDMDEIVKQWGGKCAYVAQVKPGGEPCVAGINYSATEAGKDLPPIVFLDHEHNGYGSGTCGNQGVRAAKTDYVFTTGADQFLPPNTLEYILLYAKPQTVVVGAVHHVSDKTTMDDLEAGRATVIVKDWKPEAHKRFAAMNRRWAYCHNGHNLWHRESFVALGGFDESVNHLGRTQEDHEFAARWLLAYGMNSIVFGPTFSFHFGNRHRPETRVAASRESREITLRSLGKLYAQRYFLFSEPNHMLLTHVNVLPEELAEAPWRVDGRADCIDLSWMEEGAVSEIVAIVGHKYLPSERLGELCRHAYRVLKPFGTLRLLIYEDAEYNAMYVRAKMDEAGFENERHEANCVEGTKAVEEDEDAE